MLGAEPGGKGPKQVKTALQYLFRGWLRGPDTSGAQVDWDPITDKEAKRRYVEGRPMTRALDHPRPIGGAERAELVERKAQSIAEKRHVASLGVTEPYGVAKDAYYKERSKAVAAQKRVSNAAGALSSAGAVTSEQRNLMDELRRRRGGELSPQEHLGQVDEARATLSKKQATAASLSRGERLGSSLLEAERAAELATGQARAKSTSMAEILRGAGGTKVPKYTSRDLTLAEGLIGASRNYGGYTPTQSEYVSTVGDVLPANLTKEQIAAMEKAAIRSGNPEAIAAIQERKAMTTKATARTPSKLKTLGKKGGKVGLAGLLLSVLLSNMEETDG